MMNWIYMPLDDIGNILPHKFSKWCSIIANGRITNKQQAIAWINNE